MHKEDTYQTKPLPDPSGTSIIFGVNTSCFSVNVSIKTTEGALFSNISIRRFSDSSSDAEEAAMAAPPNLPNGDDDDVKRAEVKTAAEPNII